MADSSTNLPQMTSGQASKEVTFNQLLDAASPGTLFGRNALTTTGLTWGYLGGVILVDGVPTTIANGTVALTTAATNYVEANRSGTVSANTTAFTPGSTPLYTVVAGASTITSYTDKRLLAIPVGAGRLAKAMADANQTLSNAEARCDILEATGALTALRDLVVPIVAKQWTVFANVTGGFGIRVIGASGTGITVADGKRAILYADGTNVVRVTADT